jgi:hypothetical protein
MNEAAEKEYWERLAKERNPVLVCGDPTERRRELALGLAVNLVAGEDVSGTNKTDWVLLRAKRLEEYLRSGCIGILEERSNEEK